MKQREQGSIPPPRSLLPAIRKPASLSVTVTSKEQRHRRPALTMSTLKQSCYRPFYKRLTVKRPNKPNKDRRDFKRTGIVGAEDTRAGPKGRSPTLVGHSAPGKAGDCTTAQTDPVHASGQKPVGLKDTTNAFQGTNLKREPLGLRPLKSKDRYCLENDTSASKTDTPKKVNTLLPW